MESPIREQGRNINCLRSLKHCIFRRVYRSCNKGKDHAYGQCCSSGGSQHWNIHLFIWCHRSARHRYGLPRMVMATRRRPKRRTTKVNRNASTCGASNVVGNAVVHPRRCHLRLHELSSIGISRQSHAAPWSVARKNQKPHTRRIRDIVFRWCLTGRLRAVSAMPLHGDWCGAKPE